MGLTTTSSTQPLVSVPMFFLSLFDIWLFQLSFSSRITLRYLTWFFNCNFVRNSIGFLKPTNFLLLVKRTIDVLSALTDSPIPRHEVWMIKSAFCISSHTVLRNFPLIRIAMSSANPWAYRLLLFRRLSKELITIFHKSGDKTPPFGNHNCWAYSPYFSQDHTVTEHGRNPPWNREMHFIASTCFAHDLKRSVIKSP
jgi:hypothetical protein